MTLEMAARKQDHVALEKTAQTRDWMVWERGELIHVCHSVLETPAHTQDCMALEIVAWTHDRVALVA
jgi:hypothetical protein